MYDLAGAEQDRRFSPYCWRIHMALRHKGLEFETIPWRFTQKDAIAASGQGKVPVIVDGERVVSDSWAIATYLEDTYPDRPSLFGGEVGKGVSRLVADWVAWSLLPGVFRVIALDILRHLGPEDQRYFRASREKSLKMTLEEHTRDPEARLAEVRATLAPVRATLARQPYLSGAAAAFPDYALFGIFMWSRGVSETPLVEAGDPIAVWRDRLLDAFGGAARAAKS
ncbi:glutathione S-transferase [uncultured Gammaproteobacteria bacterium]